MFFLTPGYLKQGRQFIKDARKLVSYKRDLVSEATIQDVEREIAHLESALAKRDPAAVEEQVKRLDVVCGQMTPPAKDAALRENVEVFLVAIVIALAVRTFFLQPFTIPTGSMQPTLNGIIATAAPPPNPVTQAVQLALLGRNYFNIVAREDEHVTSVEELNRSGLYRFLSWSRIETSAGNRYDVWCSTDALRKAFDLRPERLFKAGEPIARGYVNTGDHVFVDKVSYNFRKPDRGEVFVFSTHEIKPLQMRNSTTQYYIKRLGGVPNDTLRIDPPKLYVNGDLASAPGFVRVMEGSLAQPHDGYRGYGNGYEADNRVVPMNFLRTPGDTFSIPREKYFALGDNSYNSSDSRDWGLVPEENVMGRAVFVYWPFTAHWSFIH